MRTEAASNALPLPFGRIVRVSSTARFTSMDSPSHTRAIRPD